MLPPPPPGFRYATPDPRRPVPGPPPPNYGGREVIIKPGPRAVPQTVEEAGRTKAQTSQIQRELRTRPLSKEDTDTLAKIEAETAGVNDMIRDIRIASQTVQRFGGGGAKAFRTRLATPQADPEKSGIIDQTKSWLFGDQATPQQKRDLQIIDYIKNRWVLEGQKDQAGPQTESDAARLALTGVQLGNDKLVNARILSEAMLKAQFAQRKHGFFSRWANKYGALAALDGKGRSVVDAWNTFKNDASTRNAKRWKVPMPPQADGAQLVGWE